MSVNPHFACSFTHLCLFVTPRAVASQASLSMEFSRQEYWSGLPFCTPGDLPDPVIEPVTLVSPALAGRLFTPELPDQHEILVEPIKFPSVLGCSIFALL